MDIDELMQKKGIKELFPPQSDAIKAGLLESDENFLIATPTASGKTLLAEFAMLRELNRGKKCLYVVPLVALAYEKFKQFSHDFEGFASVAISTGDYDSPSTELGNYDLIVLTLEKFDALTRRNVEWLSKVGIVVIDEIHLLADPSRGPRVEGAIARFISRHRARVVALSATVGNCEEIASWLNAKLITSEWRPVPLKEEVIVGDDDEVMEYIENLVKDGGQALVFVNTKKASVSFAKKLASRLRKIVSSPELDRLAEMVDDGVFDGMGDMIRGGVAFHNTWLHPKQRHLIEDGFVQGHIKAICCTPTLAMGISFPARAAIVRNYRFYDGGFSYPMPVLMLKQIFGRAGRPEYDEYGIGVLVARDEDERDELEEKYIRGELENICSQFDQEMLEEQILGTIAGGARSRRSLEKFLENTFYHHQGFETDLDAILQWLNENGFIKLDGRIEPTQFGVLTARLYISPRTSLELKNSIELVDEARWNSFDLLMIIAKCREVPSVSTKCDPLSISMRMSSNFELIESCLHKLGSAVVLNAWIEERSYVEICDEYGVYPGEVYSLSSSAEWIAYASARICEYLGSKLLPEFEIMQRRIKHGVKRELIGLASLRGIGRVMARRLYDRGYKTVQDLLKASEKELARIDGIGEKRAKLIKEEAKREAYQHLRKRR